MRAPRCPPASSALATCHLPLATVFFDLLEVGDFVAGADDEPVAAGRDPECGGPSADDTWRHHGECSERLTGHSTSRKYVTCSRRVRCVEAAVHVPLVSDHRASPILGPRRKRVPRSSPALPGAKRSRGCRSVCVRTGRKRDEEELFRPPQGRSPMECGLTSRRGQLCTTYVRPHSVGLARREPIVSPPSRAGWSWPDG